MRFTTVADALPTAVAELVAGKILGHNEASVAIADNGDRVSRHGGRVADSIHRATVLSERGYPVGVWLASASGIDSFLDLHDSVCHQIEQRLVNAFSTDFQ